MKKPFAIIIMDGYGLAPAGDGNAISIDGSKNVNYYRENYPSATLGASGRSVGLPDGQMGNSEVGHLNMGAGRIVYQDLTKITKEIEDGEFFQNPALLKDLHSDKDIPGDSPENTLGALSRLCQEDFPALPAASYEVKYVHEALEDFLSPAFYLTPPIDTRAPNTIYINNASRSTNLELFTTLAHEGFPGHLYQNQYFSLQKPENIRYLITSGGYIEGWATYIESYAYGYAEIDSDYSRAVWLNRSINLCLYSILDVGIHYRGWTREQTASFLSAFGITKDSAIEELYLYIVETPANYLKYYLGYLYFQDIKTKAQELQGDSFRLKEFHKKVLEIGPVPFPVLEKYVLE